VEFVSVITEFSKP